MRKKGKYVLAVLVIIFLVAGVVFYKVTKDNVCPVITIDEHKIKEYSSDMEESVLVKCASATDNIDGDVSASLMVESLYVMPGMDSAKVIIVARDKTGNIGRTSYIVPYKNNESRLDDYIDKEKSQVTESESSLNKSFEKNSLSQSDNTQTKN